MQKTFKFEVVTPTGIFYEGEVSYIKFAAENGEMGILADHAPVLVATKPCTLTIEKDKKQEYAFISEGFIEVTPEKVSLVTDLADWSSDIDEEEAIRAKRIAEEELESGAADASRKTELKVSIERASARIKTSGLR